MPYKYTVTNNADPDEMPMVESFHDALPDALDAMMETIGAELSGEAGPGDKLLRKTVGNTELGCQLEYYEVMLEVSNEDSAQEFRLIIQLED